MQSHMGLYVYMAVMDTENLTCCKFAHFGGVGLSLTSARLVNEKMVNAQNSIDSRSKPAIFSLIEMKWKVIQFGFLCEM
jgi:hypothetical protein